MTVSGLCEMIGLKPILLPQGDREVTGGYCGDLLSWVMPRAQSGDAWITIMSNVNVAAVAQLTDVACVVFSEGVNPDEETLQKAKQHGINLLNCDKDSFTLCALIAKAIE
ncbi:MAG: DRTGG domain-containing protein [Eubacteriales bacterium]|nr:DRTGG domain-containing protein [Eubacteriales bacterium]